MSWACHHIFYNTTWNINNNMHVILCDVAARGVTSFQVQHLWTSNLSWKCFNNQLRHPLLGGEPDILSSVGATRQTPSGPSLAVLTWAFNSHLEMETLHSTSGLSNMRKTKSSTGSACVCPAYSTLKRYTRSCWLLQALQSQRNTITDECAGLKIDFIATVCKYSSTQFVTPLYLLWYNLLIQH